VLNDICLEEPLQMYVMMFSEFVRNMAKIIKESLTRT